MGKRSYPVWRLAIDFVPEVYSVVKQLPREEDFALGAQLRRAVVSVAANIAEGQARRHPKEFLQHLAIAKGSLAELHTLLIIAERLGYIPGQHLRRLENALADLSRLLHRLMESVSRLTTTNYQPHQPIPPGDTEKLK